MHGQVSISILIQIPITCTKKIQLALRVRMDHQYFLDLATDKRKQTIRDICHNLRKKT